ncbi:zeta toxin family protein [Nocardioides sp. LMS-CY]|uniref:zeta toxin family protein n=1 Tax=Nocardioides sp. (strain LMS-CY) TaxID=2840457 RepID=UPI001C00834F|nr:zeta toxin family protein [Nocardioides sp. LMS-CY]QWF20354.1 zeta toxin family protein [Nocardioides sp. LMS-CY]
MSTPVLHLLAGSNGAGKSTLAELVLIPRTHLPFVNADLIAEELWPGDREEQARRAPEVSQLASDERDRLLADRVSFITETVFSHPSKLDLLRSARECGYTVHLHIVMIPEDLAVERVADRVAHGGHTVPVDKIRGRYRRLWELVARARGLADRADFYDNASLDGPFRPVAAYEYGQPVGRADWPAWTPAPLT